MQAFDLYAILPELVLLVVTCLLLVASVYVPERRVSTPGVEQDIFHTLVALDLFTSSPLSYWCI